MTADADREDVTAWIDEHAHRLTTVDPEAPLTDLAPLAALIGDAIIVGLGGSTRGAHELSALAHRILRYLVERIGFRALVLEESWTKGFELDEYVRTGSGDPRALLADAWLPFRTEEILDVLRWLRADNERHPDDLVRVVGADAARIGTASYDAGTDLNAVLERSAELGLVVGERWMLRRGCR